MRLPSGDRATVLHADRVGVIARSGSGPLIGWTPAQLNLLDWRRYIRCTLQRSDVGTRRYDFIDSIESRVVELDIRTS